MAQIGHCSLKIYQYEPHTSNGSINTDILSFLSIWAISEPQYPILDYLIILEV